LRGFFLLVRWPNLAMLALTLGLLRVRLGGGFAGPDFYVLLFLVLATAGAGYAVNDLFDQAIDRANRPDRRVVGRLLSPVQATFAYLGLVVLALALPAHAGPELAATLQLTSYLANFALLAYAGWLKKTPLLGNVLVAGLSAAPVWLVGLLYAEPPLLTQWFGVFAFFISLVREVVKDLEDLSGDAQHGCRTLPVVLGERATKWVVYAVLLGYVAVLGWLLPSVPNGGWFLGLVGLLLARLAQLVARARDARAYGRASTLAKLTMLAGISGIWWVG
jgi:4-hydroxybenzoate polyprenyltransferase